MAQPTKAVCHALLRRLDRQRDALSLTFSMRQPIVYVHNHLECLAHVQFESQDRCIVHRGDGHPPVVLEALTPAELSEAVFQCVSSVSLAPPWRPVSGL